MDIERYLKDRVEDQTKYYESAANSAKRKHFFVQTAIIILGLLVPVVVNLPNSWGSTEISQDFIKGAVTILSLSLAILTGISNFRKYGDLWLTYRMTEEMIKQEKFMFLTKSGKYHKNEDPDNGFVQSIESIISSEHNKFRTIIEESKRPIKENEK